MLTVATNVKCPFSRLRTDLCTVVNAFQSIDVRASDLREKDLDSEVDADLKDQEKCIRQFAATVANRVKYHSNLLRENQFIVRNAGKSTGHLEGTNKQTGTI